MIYATRNTGSPSKIKDIAARFSIPQSHLTQFVRSQSELPYITTSRVRSGGRSLARPADQIKLGQFIRDIERDPPLVECFTKTSQCATHDAYFCPRHVQRSVERNLRDIEYLYPRRLRPPSRWFVTNACASLTHFSGSESQSTAQWATRVWLVVTYGGHTSHRNAAVNAKLT